MTKWVGYCDCRFALVWIANVYMSLYNVLEDGPEKRRDQGEYPKRRNLKKWNKFFCKLGHYEIRTPFRYLLRYSYSGKPLR